MKSPSPSLLNRDDTAITGLRKIAAPLDAARDAPPSADSAVSSLGSSDTWEADDTPESELPVPEGELLAGRYLVERMFAEGGMGIVCLGRHAQLDQPVAIKFLRRALSGRPAIVQRFLNEARALAQLRSEHVVRVIDVGQLDSGRPYLVMEHLEGVDLGALVDRNGPLSVETAVSYALQICEPLAEAHRLGIVHRDIKPENLFLWSGGPAEDIVKVLDFGLAKQLGSSKALGVTGPQDSIGSPCYMSPEQIVTPHLVDARTDIWSVGVVLHRLLSDTLPFDGANLLEVLSHVLSAVPKSLSEVNPSLDPELAAIVHRCLEKTPDARYATMTELSDALRAYLEHRREGVLPLPTPESSSIASAPEPVAEEPVAEAKILIPGVHARWPGVVAALVVLSCAAAYGVNRSGWLIPRLAADPPRPPISEGYRPAPQLAHGAFVAGPAHAPSVRAEPDVAGGHSPVSADTGLEPSRAAVGALRQVPDPTDVDTLGATPREAPPAPATDAGVTPESTDNPYQ